MNMGVHSLIEIFIDIIVDSHAVVKNNGEIQCIFYPVSLNDNIFQNCFTLLQL